MWEDFMRGNWPAVANAAPAAPATAAPATAARTSARTAERARPAASRARAKKPVLISLFARTVPAPPGSLPVVPAPGVG